MDKNMREVLLAVSTSLSTCTEALLTCVKGSDETSGVDVNDSRDYCTAVLDAEERMQQTEIMSREDMRGLLQDVYDEGYASAAEGVYRSAGKETMPEPDFSWAGSEAPLYRRYAEAVRQQNVATTQAPKPDWPCCTKPIGDVTCLNCPYGSQARKVANEMDERATVNGAKSGEEAVCAHGVTFREHCRGCDFGHKVHRFTSAHIDRSGRG